MDPVFASLSGTVLGGLIAYLLNKQSHSHQLAALREQFKTDFIAEETARHFLNHKSYTDRSFETLQKHLGGFDDDELRKILVRAGAIRVYRDDGSEWWRLLSRMDEYIENKTS
jgi:esterase/lipase